MERFLTDRHSRGTRHQRDVGSHRRTAGHLELLRRLSLPLQTPCPAVELGEGSADEQQWTWGGADALPTAPRADVTGPAVIYCVTPGETQAQM